MTGRISPSAAAIARPLLVLLPVVTFLLPALLIAFTRQPVQQAEARLLVGGFDVEAQAVPGYVEASRTLASTYARLVGTPAVEDPVAKKLGVDPGQVAGHISATAVPESSIIRIDGTGSTEAEAVRYADAAANALLAYAVGTSGASTLAEVTKDYEAAAATSATADVEAQRLARAAGLGEPSAELRAQIATAQARAATAKVRADALQARYTDLLRNGGSSGQLRVVAPAAYVGNDRRSTVQLAIAAPVALGLVVGVALATLVVNAQAARRRDDGVNGRE